MDKEPEEMQNLGWTGIVLETFKLMRAYGRILASLTATLVVPFCFVVLMHHLVSDPLLDKINKEEIQEETALKEGKVPSSKLRHNLDAELVWLTVGGLVYLIITLALSLVSFAAICYTVACIYTGKGVAYTKILSVVPKVWKRLMVTFLWWYLLMFTFQVVMIFGLVVLILVSEVLVVLFFPLSLLFIVVSVGAFVYLNMVWNIASVVSVLEDVYGSRALTKSVRLLQGKRMTSCILSIKYSVYSAIIAWLFQSLVVQSGGSGWGRVLYATLLISLFSALWLMGIIVQTVLYFTCKAYHHESIDRYALADHLDGYMGEYVPLKDPIPLETLSP